MRDLIQELMRRNVIKVAVVYLIAGWLTMQIADVMFPALQLPEWMTSAIAAMLLIGFPFALIFAWAFEMTPDGIKREADVDRNDSITPNTGRKLNQSTLIILTVAVGFLLFDKFVLRPDVPTAEAPAAAATVAEDVVRTVKPSIAVLPFVNMSGDVENEYFSDGLSEELLNVLAKIPQLHVAGRTSSFAFKGRNEDLRSIGEQLDVANILEGSVRKSNTRLRITAQLIDAESGYHLWSDTYDREMTDVFAIQDEISQAVVNALRITLLGGKPAINHGTDNLEAYEAYLKGRYLLAHINESNLKKGIEAVDMAIALDPEYANAWALRAIAEQLDVSGVSSAGSEFHAGYERVRQFALKAVALDPESAEAQFVQGLVAVSVDWDFIAAQNFFARAVELDPNHIYATDWIGILHMVLGQIDESIRVLSYAHAIDPLSIPVLRDLGDSYYYNRDYDEAERLYKRILELNNTVARAFGRLGFVAIMRGDLDVASEYAAQEETEWVREYLDIYILGQREGQSAEWQSLTNAYIAKYGDRNAYQIASLYGDVGDADSAFEWLETSYDVHDPGTLSTLLEPMFASLHDDPRWPVFLKKLGVL